MATVGLEIVTSKSVKNHLCLLRNDSFLLFSKFPIDFIFFLL